MSIVNPNDEKPQIKKKKEVPTKSPPTKDSGNYSSIDRSGKMPIDRSGQEYVERNDEQTAASTSDLNNKNQPGIRIGEGAHVDGSWFVSGEELSDDAQSSERPNNADLFNIPAAGVSPEVDLSASTSDVLTAEQELELQKQMANMPQSSDKEMLRERLYKPELNIYPTSNPSKSKIRTERIAESIAKEDLKELIDKDLIEWKNQGFVKNGHLKDIVDNSTFVCNTPFIQKNSIYIESKNEYSAIYRGLRLDKGKIYLAGLNPSKAIQSEYLSIISDSSTYVVREEGDKSGVSGTVYYHQIAKGKSDQLRKECRQNIVQNHISDYIGEISENPNKNTSLGKDASDRELVLGVKTTASILADLFRSDDSSGPFVFGIFAPWGRGKTTLARLVSANLEKTEYEVVKFNAWQYRGRPMTWVSLYETFVKKVNEQRIDHRIGIILRANISQYGIWPILSALLMVSITLIPLQYKLGYLINLVSFIGMGILLYLFLLLRTVSNPRLRGLKKYLALKSYNEHLGLQAMIGDSLRHLLYGLADPSKNEDSKYEGKKKLTLPTILYWLLIYVLASLLSPYRNVYLFNQLPWDLNIQTNGDVKLVFFQFIVSLCIVFLACVFRHLVSYKAMKLRRILLIVDDLDRCSPDELNEILESIVLMLEDQEIQKRLQVAILVDDSILKHSVQIRFEKIKELNDESNVNVQDLVREHIEKMFIAHFSLSSINKDGAGEIIDGLQKSYHSNEDDSETDEQVIQGNTPQIQVDTNNQIKKTKSLDTKRSYKENENDGFDDTRPNLVKEDSIELEKYEWDIFKKIVRERWNDGISNRGGPRFIRGLLFKYKLARRIYLETGGIATSYETDLCNAVVGATLGKPLETVKDEKIKKIAEQVSFQ